LVRSISMPVVVLLSAVTTLHRVFEALAMLQYISAGRDRCNLVLSHCSDQREYRPAAGSGVREQQGTPKKAAAIV
jgi:hypothetical protein